MVERLGWPEHSYKPPARTGGDSRPVIILLEFDDPAVSTPPICGFRTGG
ncbi:hypothetical protein [Nonomuraea sp. NPDC003804]